MQDDSLVVIRRILPRASQRLGCNELVEDVGQSEREPDCVRDHHGRARSLHFHLSLVQKKGQERRKES